MLRPLVLHTVPYGDVHKTSFADVVRTFSGRNFAEWAKGENVPRLEITGVILVNCNITINNYQYNSRASYTFVLN